MLVFPGMIVEAAHRAGIKVPPEDQVNADAWDRNEYPHWTAFCSVQLCRTITQPGCHFTNAQAIAAIPEERLRKMTMDDLLLRGGLVGLGI